MKHTRLLLPVLALALGLAFVVVFEAEPENAHSLATDLESTQSSEQPTIEPTISKNKDADKEFVVQELSQLSSPFTKERVIALNSIVKKSLDLINEFDASRKSVDLSNETQTERFVNKLDELSRKSAAVRKEMELAGVDLQNSGENYNKPIFAAMVKFVEEVDQEIRKESLLLSRNSSDF